MTRNYLRTLLKALKGVTLVPVDDVVLSIDCLNGEAKRLTRERDEIRTRYEALVFECTRHRNATWEITHK